MSRGTRDDAPSDHGLLDLERPAPEIGRPAAPYTPASDLDLPRTDGRETVRVQERAYELRGSETETLATIGAFRVVPLDDLRALRPARDAWHGDVDHLAEQGLLTRTRVTIGDRPTTLLTLTSEGKALLETHRTDRSDERPQQYHAGLVKPRELAHDAQLYRMYQAEAARIADAGGRVTRVVLDYELKRDYQAFLHRPDRSKDTSPDEDLEAFALDRRLAVIEGHLELPDLRIEYETEDGRLQYRDVELVTEHYSRSQLAGKSRAGFTLYRAAGGHGRPSRAGGSPSGSHLLERLV